MRAKTFRRIHIDDFLKMKAVRCEEYSSYFVTKKGYVISSTKTTEENPYFVLMRGVKNKDGYIRYRLVDGKKTKMVCGHTLVALTFISKKPSKKHVINHLNGVRDDNNLENIEWCLPADNERHAWKNGKENKIKRGSNGRFVSK